MRVLDVCTLVQKSDGGEARQSPQPPFMTAPKDHDAELDTWVSLSH